MRPMKCSILSPNFKWLTVMKKIYIVLAVISIALLSSCEKEKDFNDVTPIGENGVAFVLQSASTRSMDAVSETSVQRGVSIPVGIDPKGEPLFLEETIENLNPGPATKGAPAYTVNVGTLYTTMGVYASSGSFGDATFEVMDTEMYPRKVTAEGNGWRYHHNYDGNPWPDDTTPVDFYLRMPAESGADNFNYETTGSIAFDYTSTASGSAQQDILFAYTSISKEEHDGFLPNGAPVNMVHALTGVKFRSASENGNETKTIITKVEFKGLKGSGHCVVTPSNTNPVVWSGLGVGPETFSLEFTNPEYSQEAWVDGTVSYAKQDGTDPKFGDSWYVAAADRNLNNEDGELTFWFIPQEITEDVKLIVTFCVKTPDTSGTTGGGIETHEIDFGTMLNKGRTENVKWEAGQLRTYTLNPKLVDVEIFDKMEGLVKNNLHVTNTGNVSEYVRMMVIGNWYGWLPDQDPSKTEPMIMVGYTDETGDTMVNPWYREDATYGQGFDDTFPMGRPAAGRKWVRGTGSYFYYTESIGPLDKLAGTEALFQSYELDPDWIPVIYIPTASSSTRVPAVGVHLVMEVVIQAVAATGPNNEEYTWKEAWSAATGKTIDIKQ